MTISFKVTLLYQVIGLMSRAFANGSGNRSSIPGQVIPKTQKIVPDAALLNTQHYKVRIKDKVEQSREWSNALLYTYRKGSLWSPSTKVANLLTYYSIKGNMTISFKVTLLFHLR